MVDVVFNSLTCDLNIDISHDKLTLATKRGNNGSQEEPNGFWYLMGSAKATHGIKNLKGKVYFETVVTEHLKPTSIKGSLEDIAPSVRIGWSSISTRTNVGEHLLSYGYCSDGSKVNESSFTDYGEPYSINEVIVTYIDFDCKPYEIGFIRHGVQQGTAFQLPKSCPQLFPHVSLRNAKVICNFGLRAPTFPPPSDYIFIGDLIASDLNSGPVPPKTEMECDVVLMVGLHGCGKTRWASNQASSFSSKYYHVVGSERILQAMAEKGKSRVTLANNAKVYKMAESIIQTLISNFQRLQNVIFDDCFIEGDIRSKRLSALSTRGYKPRVVVVMAAEKMYEKYLETRIKSASNKPITIDDVLQQKVNLSIPEQDGSIKDIIFTDLSRKPATILAIQYNQEGANKGHKSRYVQNQLINNDPYGLNELEKYLWSKELLLISQAQREAFKKKIFLYKSFEDNSSKTPSNGSTTNIANRDPVPSKVAVAKPAIASSISTTQPASFNKSNIHKPAPVLSSTQRPTTLAQRRVQLARSRLTSNRGSIQNKPIDDRSRALLTSFHDVGRSRLNDSDSRRYSSQRGRGVPSTVGHYHRDVVRTHSAPHSAPHFPMNKFSNMDRRDDGRIANNSALNFHKYSGLLNTPKRHEKLDNAYRSDMGNRGPQVYNSYMNDFRNLVASISHRSGSRTANAKTHRLPPTNKGRHSRYDADPSRLP